MQTNIQFSTFRRRRFVQFAVTTAILLLVLQFATKAVTIQIDYTYDTNSFFAPASAERSVLESAATYVGALLLDDLEAIVPDEPYIPIGEPGWPTTGDTWEVSFQDPSDDSNTLTDPFLTVPADTVIIFAGGNDFTGGQLAEAGFGGAVTFASPAFNSTVATRGESGGTNDEVSMWGGFLSVDNVGTTWDLSLDGSTMGSGEYHLYSVLLHEIGHVIGLGTANSWFNRVSSGNFTGTEANAVFGGPVPITGTGNEHFLDDISSDIYGTATAQEPSLSKDIASEQVKLFTEVDVAALDDIGWDVASAPIPEPGVSTLALMLAAILCLRRRR